LGWFLLEAAGGDGYLGGIEELGGVVRIDGADEHGVGDAGDEGVDVDGRGEEGHGVAVGFAGVVVDRARAVGFAGDGEGAVVGVEAALDGGGDEEFVGCGCH